MSEHESLMEPEYHSISRDFEFEFDYKKDPRIKWIKDKILACVGIKDDELFTGMLEDKEMKRKMAAFVGDPIEPQDLSLDKVTLYVCKIMVDKQIYEDKEFTEWKLIPPPPPPPPPPKKGKKGKGKAPPAPAKGKDTKPDSGEDTIMGAVDITADGETIGSTEGGIGELGAPREAGDGTAEGSKISKTSINLRLSRIESDKVEDPFYFPPPPNPDDLDPDVDGTLEFYTVIHPVPIIIKYPKLIPTFGNLTHETVDRSRRYIYFVRQTHQAIPLDENNLVTMAKMPEYFTVGSTTGKMLTSLGTQLQEVFKLLFEKQFREVSLISSEAPRGTLKRQASYAGQHHDDKEDTASQINFMRPSDYRRMSNIARGENAEQRIKNMHTEDKGQRQSDMQPMDFVVRLL